MWAPGHIRTLEPIQEPKGGIADKVRGKSYQILMQQTPKTKQRKKNCVKLGPQIRNWKVFKETEEWGSGQKSRQGRH